MGLLPPNPFNNFQPKNGTYNQTLNTYEFEWHPVTIHQIIDVFLNEVHASISGLIYLNCEDHISTCHCLLGPRCGKLASNCRAAAASLKSHEIPHQEAV